ncbi:hypothetical protein F5I97DRAFT_1816957 [Phlebopus sp. FC_14]|nr:hypothetical protein F5I97DRAFT_1816957 [Phlebopus sp. FC_14]
MELKSNRSLPPIDASQLPWPFLAHVQFSTPDQITYEAVQAFIFHPHHPSAVVQSRRERVRVEVLRFHPDKFNTRILPKVKESQRAIAREVAGAVARILTRIMAGLDKET